MSRSLRRGYEVESDNSLSQFIPTWAAYNYLITPDLYVTCLCCPPFIPYPPHELSTLLMVLKQTQGINTVVMGPNHKTVITLDMQLYKKAKKREMYSDDCKGKWILRIEELHTVMAALRTAGLAIDGSVWPNYNWTID